MGRFTKMPPRTTVPNGVTKGKPAAAAASHNRTNKELQMNRVTVAFLAEQAAAQNVRMDRLMSTVESLVGIVAAILPQTAAAPVVSVAAPAAAVVVAAESVAAAAETAIDKRNAALARGRATAAANRAARKGTAAPAAAPQVEAAPVAPVETVKESGPRYVQLTKVRQNNTTAHIGTVGTASYVVAWNRTAAGWDWQIAVKGGRTYTGSVSNQTGARAIAFANLNDHAEKIGVSKVRAGK